VEFLILAFEPLCSVSVIPLQNRPVLLAVFCQAWLPQSVDLWLQDDLIVFLKTQRCSTTLGVQSSTAFP